MAYQLYKHRLRRIITAGLLCATMLLAGLQTTKAQQPAGSGQVLADLLDTWQQAKLARDLYAHLSEKYRHPVLENIGLAEKRHMRELEALVAALGHRDQIDSVIKPAGEFADTLLSQAYMVLTVSGDSSLIKALRAGAYMEEMLIYDLKRRIKRTPESEALHAFKKLRQLSEEHLRAFCQALQAKGQAPQPAILKQDEFDRINQ